MKDGNELDYLRRMMEEPLTPAGKTMPMFCDYQKAAQRTARPDWTTENRLTMAALGACGESGEFADLIKKFIFHAHDLDREKLKLELGDILWYVTEAATALEYTLEDVALANIAKLQRRYPDGFDPERSKNRGEG